MLLRAELAPGPSRQPNSWPVLQIAFAYRSRCTPRFKAPAKLAAHISTRGFTYCTAWRRSVQIPSGRHATTTHGIIVPIHAHTHAHAHGPGAEVRVPLGAVGRVRGAERAALP